MDASRHSALGSMIAPRSVAVLGASDDPSRIGGRPISYLKAAGFQGRIYPVNHKRETVQDIAAYASILDLPEPPDTVIVAVPSNLIERSIAECAERGARNCIVFSSGFAEMGEDGAQLQARISNLARTAGMRLLGPNCLGLFNVPSGFYGTFTTTLDRGMPKVGPLSIVSQSGAYGSHLYYLARQRGMGLNTWISTGNEADIQIAECLEWLAGDPDTNVILAYAEGFRDGERLIAGLEAARRASKPVIFMKVGRSQVGAEAATSHTAALAGADEVCDAILRQYGAYRARTTEEAMEIAYAASCGIFPKGRKLGLVTISGGVGVLMADEASEHDLDVTPLPENAQRTLKELLPFAGVRNPIDITAQAFNDVSLLKSNMRVVLEDGGYDAVLAFFTSVPGSVANAGGVRDAMREMRDRFPEKLIILSMLVDDHMRRDYEEMGFPVFDDPSSAVRAIAALANFSRSFARPPRIDGMETMDATLPEGPLGEREAKQLLARAGLPVLNEHLACSAEEAVQAWREFNGPVALKLASADILHKTEIGGVMLDLDDEQAVADAFRQILDRARSAREDARLDGVLVAPMVSGGLEVILGARRDPVFGPVVMFGLGGVFVEVLKDVTFRKAPVDHAEACDMIGEVRGAGLLHGMRGAGPFDRNALADAIVALSRFAHAHGESVESVELNPLRLFEEGRGAVALDALVVRGKASPPA